MIFITGGEKKHHRYAKVNIYDEISFIYDDFAKLVMKITFRMMKIII